MAEKLPYTGTLARQYDPDRFFLTLLQPAALRPALWALLAFNYEVAKTHEVVSDQTLGLMRLQWWREALEKNYAGATAPAHEILTPLAAAIRAHDLSFALFDCLIAGREFDLETETPDSIHELKQYIASTVTPLTLLMLKIGAQPEDGAAHISEAYGLAGIMRAIPYQAQQGRCFVPSHLASMDQLFRDAEKSREVLVALHNEAAQALVDAGAFRSSLLKHMGHAADMHLCMMDRLRHNVRDQRFGMLPPFYHLRLWLAR